MIDFTDDELHSLSCCVSSRLFSLDSAFKRCFNSDNVYAVESLLPLVRKYLELWRKLTDTEFVFESQELSRIIYPDFVSST